MNVEIARFCGMGAFLVLAWAPLAWGQATTGAGNSVFETNLDTETQLAITVPVALQKLEIITEVQLQCTVSDRTGSLGGVTRVIPVETSTGTVSTNVTFRLGTRDGSRRPRQFAKPVTVDCRIGGRANGQPFVVTSKPPTTRTGLEVGPDAVLSSTVTQQ